MKQPQNRRSAFTLLEVLLVLIIIGLLVSLVAPSMLGMKEKAHRNAARSQIGLFYDACEFYRFSMNEYPASLSQLVENPGAGSKWDGPYLDGAVPKDPWNRDYVYEPQSGSEKPLIYSVGPDGQPGTADDVHKEETQ